MRKYEKFCLRLQTYYKFSLKSGRKDEMRGNMCLRKIFECMLKVEKAKLKFRNEVRKRAQAK